MMHPLEPKLHAMLSKAAMSIPEGSSVAAWLSELVEKVFWPQWMTARIDVAVRLLEPACAPMALSAGALRERIIARSVFAKKRRGGMGGKGLSSGLQK